VSGCATPQNGHRREHERVSPVNASHNGELMCVLFTTSLIISMLILGNSLDGIVKLMSFTAALLVFWVTLTSRVDPSPFEY
jgi:hypothetical protein